MNEEESSQNFSSDKKNPFRSETLNRMKTETLQEKVEESSERNVRRIKTELGTPLQPDTIEPFSFFEQTPTSRQLSGNRFGNTEKKETSIQVKDFSSHKKEKDPFEFDFIDENNFRSHQPGPNKFEGFGNFDDFGSSKQEKTDRSAKEPKWFNAPKSEMGSDKGLYSKSDDSPKQGRPQLEVGFDDFGNGFSTAKKSKSPGPRADFFGRSGDVLTNPEEASSQKNQFELPSFDQNFESEEFRSRTEGKSQPFGSVDNFHQAQFSPKQKMKIKEEADMPFVQVIKEKTKPQIESVPIIATAKSEDPFATTLENNKTEDFFNVGMSDNAFEDQFRKQLQVEKIKKNSSSPFIKEQLELKDQIHKEVGDRPQR